LIADSKIETMDGEGAVAGLKVITDGAAEQVDCRTTVAKKPITQVTASDVDGRAWKGKGVVV